jgi:D-glycero-alpha-D-manno-heptose 1-phosphate guanylyltransferase
MEAIILAGGLGTRLAARVSGLPKAMAPIAGRPFLEILLRQLERCGYTRVLLSVGYLHEAIENHFGPAFGAVEIDYSIEQSPLGTGGAIRTTLALAREPAVLVLNGDTFLDADYAAMTRVHSAEGAQMTMAVTRQPDIARYGGVVVDSGRVTGFEEKSQSGPGPKSGPTPGPKPGPTPGLINAGAYVLNRNLDWPPELPAHFSLERDFLVPSVAQLRPAAFEVSGFFLDIGVPDDYDRAQTALAGR